MDRNPGVTTRVRIQNSLARTHPIFNDDVWMAVFGMKAAGANAEAEAIMRTERARESCMVFFLVENESAIWMAKEERTQGQQKRVCVVRRGVPFKSRVKRMPPRVHRKH